MADGATALGPPQDTEALDDQTPDASPAPSAAPAPKASDTVTPNAPTLPNPFEMPSTGGLDKALGMIQQNYDHNAALGKEQDAYAKQLGKVEQDYEANQPRRQELLGRLKVPQAAPAPKMQERSPVEALGSLGAVVGAFGSLFSRRPMTAAFKSMAAGMDALKQNDIDTFGRNYKTWKDETDLALKQADLENGIVKTVLDDDSKSWDQKLNLLKTYGAALNDKLLYSNAQSGNIRDIAGINEHKIDLAERMRSSMASMSPENIIMWNYRNDFQQKNGRLPNQQEETAELARVKPELARDERLREILEKDPDWKSGDSARMETAVRRATDATSPYTAAMGDPKRIALNAFIEQYKADHNGEYPPAQAIASFNASSAPVRSAPAMAMRKFMEEHPEATSDEVAEFGANYAAKSKAVAAFAAGKEAGIVRSFSTMAEHIGTLEKLGEALENGDSQDFNRVANAWSKRTGGTAPVNFEAAKNIVGAEIVKAIVGAGGGVGDREKAQAVLDGINSPAQLRGAMATIKELVHGQLIGLEKQFVDTTTLGATDPEAAQAKARETFKNRLSGKALELYGDASGAKTQIPPEARKLLTKGKNTTFGNGQVWTLDASGEPFQVR